MPQVEWALTTDVAGLWAVHDPAVAAATVRLLSSVREVEPAITSDVMMALAAAGARAYGLEYRVKSPGSLARKLGDKAAQYALRCAVPEGAALEAVAASLGDVIRYTSLSEEHDAVGTDAETVCTHLQERGWSLVEAENSYVQGNTYKGLHTSWVSPQGQKVEIQFQSRESQQIKNEAHRDYELMRDEEATVEDRQAAALRSYKKYELLREPRSVALLENLAGCKIRKKAYLLVGGGRG